jgi:hypothetical protein
MRLLTYQKSAVIFKEETFPKISEANGSISDHQDNGG